MDGSGCAEEEKALVCRFICRNQKNAFQVNVIATNF
ncbi:hypothetical protein J2Z32_002773 [Paenibacillus turicensis]|uniref:Uncharacterized protein n=1 Tax=Paenibacillus turicensis TaxID=160487 RepID=A0ABS4FU68_9BACL|nr:hypothetical protein [Paenibacillus turicensis]